MTKETKETKPVKSACKCGCEEAVKKKEIEWYDTMIESRKRMEERDKKVMMSSIVTTAFIGLAMLVMAAYYVVKIFRGE